LKNRIVNEIKRLSSIHIWCEEGELNLGEKNLQVEQKLDNSKTQNPQTLAESGPEHGASSRSKDRSTPLSNTFLAGINTILRQKCATGVLQNSLQLTHELEFIIRAWAYLDDEVKRRILAIISKKAIP
jgi:hypothetical protein